MKHHLNQMKETKEYIFIGDSHIRFAFKLGTTVHQFIAASCQGLANVNSKLQTGAKIINLVNTLSNPNIVLYFGKVDLEFIVPYKQFVKKEVNFSYIQQMDLSLKAYRSFLNQLNTKNITICGLDPPCLDNDEMIYELTLAV